MAVAERQLGETYLQFASRRTLEAIKAVTARNAVPVRGSVDINTSDGKEHPGNHHPTRQPSAKAEILEAQVQEFMRRVKT